jgi:photosystem II stability/assembly factor-like uncharacterized protein
MSHISYPQSGQWVKINGSSCYSIAILNDSSLFAGTNDGLEYTSDYGKTWFEKSFSSSSNRIDRIAINDSTNSIFIFSGSDRIIYKSTDNGNKWIESIAKVIGITGLISKYGNLYAVSSAGKLYTSTNDGVSWDSSFVTANLRSVDVCRSGQIFVGTGTAELYTSKDSGKTWKKLTYENSESFSMLFTINNKDEIISTYGNGIIVSKDFGVTWTFYSAPIEPNYPFSIAFVEDDNLYLGAKTIVKSSNTGITWTNYGGQFYSLNGIAVYNDNIYIATDGGIFYYDQSIPIYVGSNYFPLHLGNTWQYLSYSSSYRDPANYKLEQNLIEKDTLVNNYKYYSYKSIWDDFIYKNKWVRYSEVDKKIFIRDGDSDKVYMDFNLPPMATFQQFMGSYMVKATTYEGSKNIFGDTVKYKGYENGTLMYGLRRENFGENIGLLRYSNEGTFGPDYSDGRDLIMAVIYDSTNTPTFLSEKYKPEILLTPINVLDTNLFKIDFSVNHHYSKFYDPSWPLTGINFVDSVYMESYYSRNASIVMKDNIYAINTPKTNKYLISSSIDTLLLKNGFTFNYKIIAKDKGIIQETSCSPDSGYYQIKWGTTSVDDIDNKAISFNLGQNYPNPFNPSTVISWQLPISSYVTLKVFDMLGKEIATLINEERQPGTYEVEFQSAVGNRQMGSGIYFYQLRAGSFVQTKKMIYLK